LAEEVSKLLRMLRLCLERFHNHGLTLTDTLLQLLLLLSHLLDGLQSLKSQRLSLGLIHEGVASIRKFLKFPEEIDKIVLVDIDHILDSFGVVKVFVRFEHDLLGLFSPFSQSLAAEPSEDQFFLMEVAIKTVFVLAEIGFQAVGVLAVIGKFKVVLGTIFHAFEDMEGSHLLARSLDLHLNCLLHLIKNNHWLRFTSSIPSIKKCPTVGDQSFTQSPK
jgi:hypothetical protein